MTCEPSSLIRTLYWPTTNWDWITPISAKPGRAREYFSKAFQSREHASEWEKLAIAADYYLNVTGELDKAAQTYEEWTESYPRDDEAYLSLGVVYASEGQYEKAAESPNKPSALYRL